MRRLLLVLVAVLAVAGLTLARLHAAALAVGIVAGVLFFLGGIGAGGGPGNARRVGQGPADVNSRIGICLAAAGIAAAALGHDPPFPPSFRIFYGVCQAVGCVGALALAGWAARPPASKRGR